MSRRDDSALVLDIIQAVNYIHQFTAGMDLVAFGHDKKTQFAVCHQLALIGEASTKLTDEFKKQNTAIPWSKMVGMRNHLIHAYHDINLKTTWQTVTHEVPDLLVRLKAVAPKRPT